MQSQKFDSKLLNSELQNFLFNWHAAKLFFIELTLAQNATQTITQLYTNNKILLNYFSKLLKQIVNNLKQHFCSTKPLTTKQRYTGLSCTVSRITSCNRNPANSSPAIRGDYCRWLCPEFPGKYLQFLLFRFQVYRFCPVTWKHTWFVFYFIHEGARMLRRWFCRDWLLVSSMGLTLWFNIESGA